MARRVWPPLIVLALFFASFAYWARINISPSLPLGIYIRTQGPIHLGAVIMMCPPHKPMAFVQAAQRGYFGSGSCAPLGTGTMLKRVSALPGMVVSILPSGVWVEGHLIPHSIPRRWDSKKAPLPLFRLDSYRLQEHEYLLMGNTDHSFDARYFGPTTLSDPPAYTVMQPFWTLNSSQEPVSSPSVNLPQRP